MGSLLGSSSSENSTDIGINTDSFLKVTPGRPSMDEVIESILKADRPGVYSCGPHALMESLEDAIRLKRNDCAFYREDSEM